MTRFTREELEFMDRARGIKSKSSRQRKATVRWLVHMTILIILGMLIIGNQQSIMVMQVNTLNTLQDMQLEVEAIEPAPKLPTEVNSEATTAKIGEFTITHYCDCMVCCGKTDGITAMGTKATANRTIAVDPKVIPLGTELIIDGQTYIAEDVGGAIKGNKIDIFVDSHQEAVNRGKIKREVFYDYGGTHENH